ncbi:MAG TPA: hypothetical protein VFX30_05835 [bacterium]|nr:hypothetical protein [bacterium]
MATPASSPRKPASGLKIAFIVFAIIAGQVALYSLVIFLFSFESGPPIGPEIDFLWSVKKNGPRSGSEGLFRLGDGAFFVDGTDASFPVVEMNLEDGSVDASPGLPTGGGAHLDADGGSLFVYDEGQGLFQKISGDAPWKKVAPRLPADGRVGLDAAGGEVFALVAKAGTREIFRWNRAKEEWEKLGALTLPEKEGANLETSFCRIGDDLLVFVSLCHAEGGCGSEAPQDQSLHLYSLRSGVWTTTPAAWGEDEIRTTAESGASFLLLGAKALYRFDADKRRVVEVASLSAIFPDSTYSPHLRVAGSLYVGAGDRIYFFDDGLQQLVDPLPKDAEGKPAVRYWYDTSDRNRVLIRGDRAFIQVSDGARQGLGYFLRKEGAWAYQGLVDGLSYVSPLDVSDRGLLLAGYDTLSLLPLGFEACASLRKEPGETATLAALLNELGGSFVRGRIRRPMADFCRFDLEYSAAGGKRTGIVKIEGKNNEFLKNFLLARDGDTAAVSLSRSRGFLTADRVFLDPRGGVAVEGQEPIYREGPTWLVFVLAASMGLGCWAWGLRSLAKPAPDAFRKVFSEEKARAAARLRTVGFAVWGLAVLFLVQRVGGRPYGMMEAAEALSLKLGAFLVGFAVVYYIGAVNLIGLLRDQRE